MSVITEELLSGKGKSSIKAFCAPYLGQAHGSFSISVKVMVRLEFHLYNLKYLLGGKISEYLSFNKCHSIY